MNKRYLLIGVLFCAVVAISGCTIPGSTESSGNQTPNVQGVTAVALTGPGTVTVEMGDEESISVEGADSNVEYIKTGPSLEIRNKGSSDVKVNLKLRSLSALTVTGVGTINVTGSSTAENLAVTITGEGTVNAPDLVAQTAEVTITSEGEGGNALVNVARTLIATVTGSGSVTYKGNPQVQETVTGGGKVTKA